MAEEVDPEIGEQGGCGGWVGYWTNAVHGWGKVSSKNLMERA